MKQLSLKKQKFCGMNNSVPNDVKDTCDIAGREEHERITAENNWSSSDGYYQSEDATEMYSNTTTQEHGEATAENNWSSYDGYNQMEDAAHIYDNTATQEHKEVMDTNQWTLYDGYEHYDDGEHTEASADNYWAPQDGHNYNQEATHTYYNPVTDGHVDAADNSNWSSYDGYNQSEDATHMYDNHDSQETAHAAPEEITEGNLHTEPAEAYSDETEVGRPCLETGTDGNCCIHRPCSNI